MLDSVVTRRNGGGDPAPLYLYVGGSHQRGKGGSIKTPAVRRHRISLPSRTTLVSPKREAKGKIIEGGISGNGTSESDRNSDHSNRSFGPLSAPTHARLPRIKN